MNTDFCMKFKCRGCPYERVCNEKQIQEQEDIYRRRKVRFDKRGEEISTTKDIRKEKRNKRTKIAEDF